MTFFLRGYWCVCNELVYEQFWYDYLIIFVYINFLLMKNFYLYFFYFLTSAIVAQQIDNGDMEAWDNLGAAAEEPANWNSFMTATGGLAFLAHNKLSNQLMFLHLQTVCIVPVYILKALWELLPVEI